MWLGAISCQDCFVDSADDLEGSVDGLELSSIVEGFVSINQQPNIITAVAESVTQAGKSERK